MSRPATEDKPYTKLVDGAPTVADDMMREWSPKPTPEPTFTNLVAEVRARGGMIVQTDAWFEEAEQLGFRVYWVNGCDVFMPVTRCTPLFSNSYFYIPKNATYDQIRDAMRIEKDVILDRCVEFHMWLLT